MSGQRRWIQRRLGGWLLMWSLMGSGFLIVVDAMAKDVPDGWWIRPALGWGWLAAVGLVLLLLAAHPVDPTPPPPPEHQ